MYIVIYNSFNVFNSLYFFSGMERGKDLLKSYYFLFHLIKAEVRKVTRDFGLRSLVTI